MADYTWKLVLVFNWKVFVLDQTWLYHKSKAQNFIFLEEGLFRGKTSTKKESTALQKVGTLFSNMLKTLLSKSTRVDIKLIYFLLLKNTKNNQIQKCKTMVTKTWKVVNILRRAFHFMYTLSAESFQGKSNSNMKKPQMLPPHQTKKFAPFLFVVVIVTRRRGVIPLMWMLETFLCNGVWRRRLLFM